MIFLSYENILSLFNFYRLIFFINLLYNCCGDSMKNKGFTLSELLGVIALLGIISLITVPAIDRSLNKGKTELYETQIEQLKKGLKDYLAENIKEMPQTTGEKTCKTISELQSAGSLPLNIKNPQTNEAFSQTTKVCVEKVGDNEFNYKVNVVK